MTYNPTPTRQAIETPRARSINAAIEAALQPYREHLTTATGMLLINQYRKIGAMETELHSAAKQLEALQRENEDLKEINRVANALLGAQAQENDKINNSIRSELKACAEALRGMECHCLNSESRKTEFACPRCRAIDQPITRNLLNKTG